MAFNGVSSVGTLSSVACVTRMQLSRVLCFGFLPLAQGLWAATGWRLTPSAPTGDMGDGWTVREVQFFALSGCGGDPIPHESTIPGSASAIADGRLDSTYQGCNPCKPHQEYVGYRPVGGLDGLPTVARCLKIFQCYSSGCVPSLLLQAEVDGQWRDATIFTTKGADAWTTVELDFRRPSPPLPPPPPSLSPSTLPSPPPSVLSDGEASQGLSVGAIAGIAAGGAMCLALLLGICCLSVHVCRKMNRELEKAKTTATQKSVLSPPGFTTTSSVGDLPVAVPEVNDAAIEMHPTS